MKKTLIKNRIVYDTEIPKVDKGFWGLKVNGGPVQEVIWSDRKPFLTMFHSVRPQGFGPDYFPGIDKLEVVKVTVEEKGEPEHLARYFNESDRKDEEEDPDYRKW